MRISSMVSARLASDPAGVARRHDLAVLGSIVWCRTCGLFAEQRIRALAEACRGKPPQGSTISGERDRCRKLDLLSRGLHPVSGEPVSQLSALPVDSKTTDPTLDLLPCM